MKVIQWLIEQFKIYIYLPSIYQKGFIDGFNKAKETLFTKEQVREDIDMARNYNDGWIQTEDEIIQSLK
jgi:hypothetical protein